MVVPARARWRSTCFTWESFGEGLGHRHRQAARKLRRKPRSTRPDMANLLELSKAAKNRDTVFLWNWHYLRRGEVPNGDWIVADRDGITICDATSAAFAMELPWEQARRHHFLLAESSGRRSGARHARSRRPTPWRGWRATRRIGRRRRSSGMTKRRQDRVTASSRARPSTRRPCVAVEDQSRTRLAWCEEPWAGWPAR